MDFVGIGPDHYCPGCTWFTDNVPSTAPALLADKGITWVTVSDMPLAQMEAYWARMGWTLPFASSRGTTWPCTAARRTERTLRPAGLRGPPTYIIPTTMELGGRATGFGRFRKAESPAP
jgi:predicted dithiol-disulfide oxidoreductase (DUF899 family)